MTKWIGAQDSGDLFISAITILEIERGILGIQHRDAIRVLACEDEWTATFALNLPGAFCQSMTR